MDNYKTAIHKDTKYNICTIAPENFDHNGTWTEIVENLFYSFQALGYQINKKENFIDPTSTNIVIGGSFLDMKTQSLLPSNSIVYNFEQLSDDNVWLTKEYRSLLENFQVWDYSKKNISYLKNLNLKYNPIYFPLGFNDKLERIEKKDFEDIDVLFYGSNCSRRSKVLNELKSAGLNVRNLFGCYGHERDNYIARSKVILNIHYYPTNIFEMARAFYLLINKKAIVSELSPNSEVPGYIESSICFAKYDDLVSKCKEIVENMEIRKKYESNGYKNFKNHLETDFLKGALELTSKQEKNENKKQKLHITGVETAHI